MSSDATVCILTFNGEEFLDDLLRAVCNQETRRSYDVLVIDSGSTDSTLDICALYDEVRVHTIDNSEFGHGKTRNLAVELANSEYVLFLTQDAVPASSQWLDAMLEPFELFDTVSCVFGKQVPRPDCVTIVKREVSSLFSRLGDDASISIQRISPLTEAKEIANMFFSDVNSAVKKSCMLEIPFRDVSYAEDQALAIDHLTRGWMKAYAPLGAVFHSHDYPPRKYFSRKVDEIIGIHKSIAQGHTMKWSTSRLRILGSTLRDWEYIVRDHEYTLGQKLSNFLRAPLYNYLLVRALWITRNPEDHDKVSKHSLEKKLRSTNN